jgi:uncharacterized protein (TIGR00645 family)
MRQIERGFLAAILVSRWLLAPFLVGLVLTLFLLMYRFFADFYQLVLRLPGSTWHDLIVGVLNMIDIALTANLILIVIFSGYENFLRKIEDQSDWPEGLTAIDFGTLKQRLIGSIAAIATVDALAWYLALENLSVDTSKLAWVIAFPVMFVAIALVLAIADRLMRRDQNAA